MRQDPNTSDTIPMPRLVWLHLAPGIMVFLLYISLAPLTVKLGYPPVMALLMAAFLGVAGFELGHLLLLSWRRNRDFSLRGIILYVDRPPALRFVGVTAGVTVLSISALLLLSGADKFVLTHLFSWLPAWYNYFDPIQYKQVAHSSLVITAVARFLIDGLGLPIIEELYFRGYLLPRIPAAGSAAVVINAGLFTLYHLWQPFNYPTIFILALMLAYTVRRTQSTWIGISVHVLLNMIGCLLALMIMLHA